MKALLLVFGLLLVAQTMATAEEIRSFDWYESQYPFMRHKEKSRAIARVAGYAFPEGKVAVGIHLPWRTVRFHDHTIPIQLNMEYLLAKGDTSEFRWLPREGDTITIERVRTGQPVAYRGRELRFNPKDTVPLDDAAIDATVDLAAKWSNYGTLAKNAVPVDTGDIKPGDMLIAQEEVATKGRVYTVLVVIENDSNERLYLVGTGCQKDCDFHIPFFGEQGAETAWLTKAQLLSLAHDYAKYGVYRFEL